MHGFVSCVQCFLILFASLVFQQCKESYRQHTIPRRLNNFVHFGSMLQWRMNTLREKWEDLGSNDNCITQIWIAREGNHRAHKMLDVCKSSKYEHDT